MAVFMSLHGPAVTCIPVASMSPIHIPPIQCALKYRHAHIYIHACDPKQSPGGGESPPAGV